MEVERIHIGLTLEIIHPIKIHSRALMSVRCNNRAFCAVDVVSPVLLPWIDLAYCASSSPHSRKFVMDLEIDIPIAVQLVYGLVYKGLLVVSQACTTLRIIEVKELRVEPPIRICRDYAIGVEIPVPGYSVIPATSSLPPYVIVWVFAENHELHYNPPVLPLLDKAFHPAP